jgi:serine/threonine-protein kinase HipA
VSRARTVEVIADWPELGGATRMGTLTATLVRGKEDFAFRYDDAWLASGLGRALDPDLGLFRGDQYPPRERDGFGVFLDSSPDRWGRLLQRRRERLRAAEEGRAERKLLETHYLLGVHDGHRFGALRFRVDGRFLDDDDTLAAPPMTSLRDLEHASLSLERDDSEAHRDYARWVRMLVVPGGSLGGARPKASVRDDVGRLWIAKFPSRHDDTDVGAWEATVHALARRAGVTVPEAMHRRFAERARGARTFHTFLSQRFDRGPQGERLHVASAMTLLGRNDGDGAATGVGYVDLADLLVRLGASPAADLEQLWRRIVFAMCVANTDDHLRNHAFFLTRDGWRLAPAFDVNPTPEGDALTLAVSESDSALDLELARSVAGVFRVTTKRAAAIVAEVREAVAHWRTEALAHGIPKAAHDRMRDAFRLADGAPRA